MSEEIGEFGVLVQFGILVSECREEEGKGRNMRTIQKRVQNER